MKSKLCCWIVVGMTLSAYCLKAEDLTNSYQVNTWIGGSKDWNATGNWSTGKVPAANDKCNVLIPAKAGRFPEIKGEGVVDGILTIEKGAILLVTKSAKAKGALTVWDSNADAKAGIVNKGDLAVDADAIVTVGNGGFTNDGTVRGALRLVFKHPCSKAEFKPGTAAVSELVIGDANVKCDVTVSSTSAISGNLVIKGGTLTINKDAVLTVKGNLLFSGTGKQTTALAVAGNVEIHGNIACNESVISGGGNEKTIPWITLVGKNDQEIKGNADGILPPMKIVKPEGGVVKIVGDMSCAGLWVEKGSTLDVTAAKQIKFGGAGMASSWSRGFTNKGTVKGNPALLYSQGCFGTGLEPGGAPLASLTIDTGHYAYPVTLAGDLEINGDLTMIRGSLNANSTVTIKGSCRLPPPNPNKEKAHETVCMSMGEKCRFVFTGPTPAVLEAGGPEVTYPYSTCLRNLEIDKPAGTFKITKAPQVVNEDLKVKNDLILEEGGEVWLGVVRQSTNNISTVVDVGLKIKTSLTKDLLPDVTPAAVPAFVPGSVRLIDNVIGPKLDPVPKLVNIAPYADIRVFPYSTMARNMVDPDEQLRTSTVPEMLGGHNNFGVKTRYEFHFDQPQSISQVRWSVPGGTWALLADTTGNGVYDKILRLDLEGKIDNPEGVWKSRAWVTNNFQPEVKAYGIQLVCLRGGPVVYGFQILVPEGTAQVPPAVKETAGVQNIETGDVVEVPVPPLEKQFMKGFHIEPWMFIGGWQYMPKDRPPLAEFKGFEEFIKALKKYHANTVNLWPPKDWKTTGPGVYESSVLWPSQYDKWSVKENVLEMAAKAFHDNGIKFFVMDRCVYPKKLEEFPKTDTSDKPGYIVSRHDREYLKGIVLEQVKSGVDGVGIGFDEQQGDRYCLRLAKDPATKEAFEARHKVKAPDKPESIVEDTESYRHWYVFNYECFASYLGDAAAAAKKANPNIITKSPVHANLGILWNGRLGNGIAEDIMAHEADIDMIRAYNYGDLASSNIGHYLSAANTKRIAGANKGKGAVSLHNCAWGGDQKSSPGYFLHFPPVCMNGFPISSVMHGASMPLYWRYNFIYYGGYDKYVEQAFSILDTFAAWGGKEAQIPKQILMLKSRASEDWWQLRQNHNAEGRILDNTRGYFYEKWLMEFLLSNGYQFQVRYLEYPQDYEKDLASCDLVILPFPYSVSQKAFQAISSATDKGAKVLIFDRQGETDEWGNAYKAPLFSSMISSGKAVFIKDDVTNVGHHPKFNAGMKDTMEKLLGSRKLFSFNSYGNDVESICLEKGPAEKFVCLINWTDRPLSVDAGLLLPDKGSYEVLQRDLTEVRRVSIGGKSALSAKELKMFRVPLKEWEIKLLYVKAAGK